MKAEELTIEFKAKMTVDKRTAEGCLHLVEMFVNDTGAKIIVDKDANGEMRFHYEFAERFCKAMCADGKDANAGRRGRLLH